MDPEQQNENPEPSARAEAGTEPDTAQEPELPRWQSHKTVHALKIQGARLAGIGNERQTILSFDAPYNDRAMSRNWTGTGKCGAGINDPEVDRGWLVIYEDGYDSWSPSQAFESGYSLIEAGQG